MEDEEGEIFNNTYLADMKAGRMSHHFGRDSFLPLSEIEHRNSLCPPHLRSSYAIQFDPEIEEEFRVRRKVVDVKQEKVEIKEDSREIKTDPAANDSCSSSSSIVDVKQEKVDQC
jgi:hypothetical protein